MMRLTRAVRAPLFVFLPIWLLWHMGFHFFGCHQEGMGCSGAVRFAILSGERPPSPLPRAVLKRYDTVIWWLHMEILILIFRLRIELMSQIRGYRKVRLLLLRVSQCPSQHMLTTYLKKEHIETPDVDKKQD